MAKKASKKVNEKKTDEKKESNIVTVKKKKFRKGSRPHTLFLLMEKGHKLENLLEHKELLVKYNGMKSWIRNDFERLSA